MQNSTTEIHSSRISGVGEIEYSTHFHDNRDQRIKVGPDGRFRVVLPQNSDIDAAEEILQENKDWVKQQTSRFSAALEEIDGDKKRLVEDFVLLGEPFNLEWRRGQFGVEMQQDKVVVSTPKNRSEYTYLKNWLKEYLREKVGSKGSRFADDLGVEFDQVHVRNQKTKWASCSSQGTLSFNIRAAFLPEDYFEYLVAHEVAHLRHPHHGKEFWNEVHSLGFQKENYEPALDGYWILAHRNKIWQELISHY